MVGQHRAAARPRQSLARAKRCAVPKQARDRDGDGGPPPDLPSVRPDAAEVTPDPVTRAAVPVRWATGPHSEIPLSPPPP